MIRNTDGHRKHLVDAKKIFLVCANEDKTIFLLDLKDQGPNSLTMLKKILCLVLQNFLYLAVFKCNTTSNWLNRTVQPNRSCVTFKFPNILEKKTKNVLWDGW